MLTDSLSLERSVSGVAHATHWHSKDMMRDCCPRAKADLAGEARRGGVRALLCEEEIIMPEARGVPARSH